MIRPKVILVLVAILMIRGTHARASDCVEHPVTLAAMQDCYRPLLVFASSGSDGRFKAQVDELQQHSSDLRERDVMVVIVSGAPAPDPKASALSTAVLKGEEAKAARKQFGVSEEEFSVILVGKDGGEKFRQSEVLSAAMLNKKIDGMPMRKDEMRQR